MKRALTYAEKVAHAKARMQALGIEPITTRTNWKSAVTHLAPEAPPKPAEPLPKTVTKIRRTA